MLSLSLLLSQRFATGQRRKGMVSLISWMSTLGIALGVAVLIIGLSAMNGFERELKHRILSVVPHGEIEPVSSPLQNWQPWISRIEKINGIDAAAPYITFSGLLENGSQLRAIQAKGVDPIQETRLSALPNFVQNNAWVDFVSGKQHVILGSGVAKLLKVKQGDWVTLIFSQNENDNQLSQPKRIRLQVQGILRLSGILDNTLVLLPLKDAQHYLEMGESVTGVALKMQDPFQATRLVRDAAEKTQDYVYARSWMGSYGYMYRDIQMIRAIMYLAMLLVMGVACFNIVSTLIMAVKEKNQDIAILRTLGAKNGFIRAIFIFYGLRTGALGCFIGMLLGIPLALNLTAIVANIEKLTGRTLLAGDVYFIDFLPTELHLHDVIFVVLTALLLSFFASGYPAWRASRIHPAHVLSGK